MSFNEKHARLPNEIRDPFAIKRRDNFIGAGLIALVLAVLSGGTGASGVLFLGALACFGIASQIKTVREKKGEVARY